MIPPSSLPGARLGNSCRVLSPLKGGGGGERSGADRTAEQLGWGDVAASQPSKVRGLGDCFFDSTCQTEISRAALRFSYAPTTGDICGCHALGTIYLPSSVAPTVLALGIGIIRPNGCDQTVPYKHQLCLVDIDAPAI